MRRICQQIVKVEWLLLILVAPLFLFPSPARSPVLLILPLLWGSRRVAEGRFVVATPLDLALLVLLSMVLVSLFATNDLAYSLPKIAGLLFGVVVFYAVVALAERPFPWLWWGVAGLWLGGVGMALLSLLGTNWSAKIRGVDWLITRLPEPLFSLPGAAEGFHPNQVAGTLLWVSPVAMVMTAVLLKQRSQIRYGRLLLLLAIGTTSLFLFVLLLTQSRGAWLGFGIACLFFLSTYLRSYRRAQLALLVFGAIVGGIWITAVTPPIALEQIKTQSDILFNLTGGDELTGRLEIWSRGLWAVQDFSFTGMGMNNFRRLGPQLYPYVSILPGQEIAHAHNDWLQVALDLGIPGLVAYLALWGGLLGMLWQLRTAVTPTINRLATGMAGALLAYLIYGLTDTVALGAKPGVLFWLLAGLVVAAYRMPQQENR